MNKSFATILGAVALVAGTVGASPAQANYKSITATTTTPVPSGNIAGASGSASFTEALTATGAQQVITVNILGTQQNSYNTVQCAGNASASDYSVGGFNTVNCPPGVAVGHTATGTLNVD